MIMRSQEPREYTYISEKILDTYCTIYRMRVNYVNLIRVSGGPEEPRSHLNYASLTILSQKKILSIKYNQNTTLKCSSKNGKIHTHKKV